MDNKITAVCAPTLTSMWSEGVVKVMDVNGSFLPVLLHKIQINKQVYAVASIYTHKHETWERAARFLFTLWREAKYIQDDSY